MTDTPGLLEVDPIDRHALLRQLEAMMIAPSVMSPEELRDFIVAAISNDRVVPSLAAEVRTRAAEDEFQHLYRRLYSTRRNLEEDKRVNAHLIGIFEPYLAQINEAMALWHGADGFKTDDAAKARAALNPPSSDDLGVTGEYYDGAPVVE